MLGFCLKLSSCGGGLPVSQLIFAATNNATQATAAAPEEVDFQTEDFDPESSFASNRFTVLAAYNGYYAELFAGVYFTASNTSPCNLTIQVSTDSGSNWTDVATKGADDMDSLSLSSAPVLLSAGDIYRVLIDPTGSPTIANDAATFFRGYTL